MSGGFSAVRAVGNALPADLLARVSAGDAALGGLTSGGYHLAAGESPREAANRAWSYLTGAWSAFQDALKALPDGDPAVGVTRERWLHVLFRELDYGRLQTTPAGGIEVGGKRYPVSHQWGAVPIHLLGWGVDLDRRTKSVPGAADRAPHAMLQELLNRSDQQLWGVVSNGRVLRVLRDSTSLSSQSYVEFDIDSIFTSELFSDFVLLYLLLHQSRVEVLSGDGGPDDCWLERWRTAAIDSGTRALSLLSDGVKAAIEDLGTGFVRANPDLRARLDDDLLDHRDFHHALLRLVYRLLFLFVAEDRDALHAPDADRVAVARYRDYFSTSRLRWLALRRRGSRHTDLWETQRLVIAALGREYGQPELGLPGLGGIFDDDGTELFVTAALPNDALLSALRRLSMVRPAGQPPRTVDYKNLGAEELGGIYESLLELVPRYNRAEQTFVLANLAGNDRKTTGSYYTPSSLIDLLLDETLTPLLDEAVKRPDPEAALLAMTVCDPACGSGHFLVAAARRIAERLAIVRTGEVDPTPTDLQGALYDVVNTCIYGVDLNPLAAELAKVSLWLESLQAGRALSFLDAHIKVGNALLGTTPTLLALGLPDDAFTALAGDDKKFTTALKRRNKAERDAGAGEETLFDLGEVGTSNIDLRTRLKDALMPSASGPTRLRDVHAARKAYTAFQADPDLARERLRADAWCAAFFQKKFPGGHAITSATIEAIGEGTAPNEVLETVRAVAVRHRFFHWHLEFPEIFDTTTNGPLGWGGGFMAMVGNPPWETVQMSEKEFFAARAQEIANAPNAAARKRAIELLVVDNPELFREFEVEARRSAAETAFIRSSGRYPLCGRGKINTYAIFAELFRSSIGVEGAAGVVTPTGLATDATTAEFFADTVRSERLVAFYDFENEAKIFPGVHNAVRFAISCISGGRRVESARLSFVTRHVRDAIGTRFSLVADEISRLNPNTGTLPMFRTRRDAEITLRVYEKFPILLEDETGVNSWNLTFRQGLFNMATDSGLFLTADDLRSVGASFDGWHWEQGGELWLPLYEAKMLSHWDHRFATYEGATQAQLNKGTLPRVDEPAHDDPEQEPLARYWVTSKEVDKELAGRWGRDWLIGWRDITGQEKWRTYVPSVLPASAVGNKFPLVWFGDYALAPLWQAMSSSFVFDYVSRQKLSGTGMTFFIVKQLAAPAPSEFEKPLAGVTSRYLSLWLRDRVLELTYTSRRIAPYAVDVLGLESGEDPGTPFRWLPARREQLRAELDAAMFMLYGLDRDEVEHVMDSFFVVRKYDERDHGEFRTKRLILEAYDAVTAAAASGSVYKSPLDPPPGAGPRHPRRS